MRSSAELHSRLEGGAEGGTERVPRCLHQLRTQLRDLEQFGEGGEGGGGGARRRSPSPVAAAASEEEEDGAEENERDHQQEEEGDQHQEDKEQEDEEGGEEEEEEEGEAAIPAIWQRGPSRLPERPIPLERQPIIRPDGKR